MLRYYDLAEAVMNTPGFTSQKATHPTQKCRIDFEPSSLLVTVTRARKRAKKYKKY